MAKNNIRRVIKAATKDPAILRLIKTNPEKLAARFRLNNQEVRALRSADRLLVQRGRLAGTTTYTFQTGTTITVTTGRPGRKPRKPRKPRKKRVVTRPRRGTGPRPPKRSQ